MSIRFTVNLPLEEIPSPVDFVKSLTPLWQPDFMEQGNVKVLPLLSNVVRLVCPQLDELGEHVWVQDRSYCFYLSNISTRGLEVWYKDGAFNVRLLSLSCPEEWEVAFQMLELATGCENALLETNWPPHRLRLNDIRTEFGPTQISGLINGQIDSVLQALCQTEMVGLHGPIMETNIGEWVVSQLNALNFDGIEANDWYAQAADVIFSMMRLVNYFPAMPQFERLQVPRITSRVGGTGKETTVAIIEPYKAYIVPKVDLVFLTSSRGTTHSFSPQHFRQIAGQFFQQPTELMFFDEVLFAMGPISPDRLDQFLQLIESVVDPTPQKWFSKAIQSARSLIDFRR